MSEAHPFCAEEFQIRWSTLTPDHVSADVTHAIEQGKANIEAIKAVTPKEATFENTFVALEKSGKTLNRLQTIFDVHTSNLATGPIPDIEKAVAPKMSKFSDSIIQNSKLQPEYGENLEEKE